MAARCFQFGRYLLLSGSREGSEATPLFSIWSNKFIPPFDANHTLNINTQENYWSSEPCNLSGTHLPLFDFLHKMEKSGKIVAEKMYGCRGMVCHHKTDVYGDCAPQDAYAASAFWPTGGAWLGMHLWDHFLFTQDLDFLRQEYHILDELALFFVDFLIPDRDGYLATCPSLSPENRFYLEYGTLNAICAGPTTDNQIIRELMLACIQGAEYLGIENKNLNDYRHVLERLRPNEIGSDGRIKEWAAEERESLPSMAHLSHLMSVYPFSDINWKGDPDIYRAAHKSLEVRMANGSERLGWPVNWHIAMNARFFDTDRVDHEIQMCLDKGITNSLLSCGVYLVSDNPSSQFSADGSLGFPAAIAECLLQSHVGIHFLPSLPASWKNGRVKGLRARGDVEVALEWKDRKLTAASLSTGHSGRKEFIGAVPAGISCEGEGVEVEKTAYGYFAFLEKDKEYVFSF